MLNSRHTFVYVLSPKEHRIHLLEDFQFDTEGWTSITEAVSKLPGICSCQSIPKLTRIVVNCTHTNPPDIKPALEAYDISIRLISANQLLREKHNEQRKMYAGKIRQKTSSDEQNCLVLLQKNWNKDLRQIQNTVVVNVTNIRCLIGMFVNSLSMSQEIRPFEKAEGIIWSEETSTIGIGLKWKAMRCYVNQEVLRYDDKWREYYELDIQVRELPVIGYIYPNSPASRATLYTHVNQDVDLLHKSSTDDDEEYNQDELSLGDIIVRIGNHEILELSEEQIIDLLLPFAMGSTAQIIIGVRHKTLDQPLRQFVILSEHISEENIYKKMTDYGKFQKERSDTIKSNLLLMSGNQRLMADVKDFYDEGHLDISDYSKLKNFTNYTQTMSRSFPIEIPWLWVVYSDYKQEHPEISTCGYCDCSEQVVQQKSFTEYMRERNESAWSRYLTAFTQHSDYTVDVGDLLRFFYECING